MKILRILISFALINIMVAELEEYLYKKHVYLTNRYIQLAVSCDRFEMYRSGHLMTVVKNIVLGEYTVVEMAIMLVVPETEEVLVIKNKTHGDSASSSSIASMEIEISGTNEALVIKHDKLWYQEKLRSEILAVTGPRRARLDKVELSRSSMASLGRERRFFTGAAIKNAIHAIVISKKPDWIMAFSDFSWMCRLLAVFRSFLNVYEKLPFIKSAEVHDGTCVLKALDMSETKYRYVDEEIWQLNGAGTKLQKLSIQVE